MSADQLLECTDLDDDAYFASLAAGTAAPASALPDPDERPGTAGRAAAQTTPPPAPRRAKHPEGPNARVGPLERARAALAARRAQAADLGPRDAPEALPAGAESTPTEPPSRPAPGPSGQRLRGWRPGRVQLASAVALFVVVAAIAASPERRGGAPARAGGAVNGAPAVRGEADLRLGWRAPTDARPRELTLGGRLTVGRHRTPVAGARLDVLAGDQAGSARMLARVRTDRGGRFRLPLSIAGRPPSLLTVSFRARGGDRVPVALASARLHVRSAAPPRKRRQSRRSSRRAKPSHQKEKKR